MFQILRKLIIVASAGLLVAGCATEKEKNCPASSVIIETSIATLFKEGTTPDPANILYTVEVAGVQSACAVDKLALNSSSSVDISFRATRAPNGGAVDYKVPYFVAVSQFDRLLAKKLYVAEFSFAPGATTATFSESVNSIDVNAGKDKKTFDYVILVGLQLTKEQLDYNRASGRLNP
jgi:hypothetical protein